MAAGTAALLVAVLLNSFQAQGSEVFVLRGSDLHLDVTAPVYLTEENDFLWKFGDSKVVRLTLDKKPTIFPTYKKSVDFIQGNYSLIVKDVQHKNSGIYKAVVSGEKDKLVTEYKVTVQDKVSSVNLTVTPNNSSSSCNVTVTCSTEDSNISRTFQCDDHNCSLVEETNLTPTIQTSFIVYLKQDYIICNHSNQVSWKHDEKKLKAYCKTESGFLLASTAAITVTGIAVPIVCLALAFIFIYRKCKRKRNENTDNGISQEMDPNVYQNPTEEAPALHPSSTYATVQFQDPPGNSETKHTLLDSHRPETVYAQVQRHDGAQT